MILRSRSNARENPSLAHTYSKIPFIISTICVANRLLIASKYIYFEIECPGLYIRILQIHLGIICVKATFAAEAAWAEFLGACGNRRSLDPIGGIVELNA